MEENQKLNLIKDYELSQEKIENIEKSLVALYKKYIGKEEILNDKELRQLQIEQSFLSMEMTLRIMRNSVAVHMQHELDNQTMGTRVQDDMNEMMKKMGFDADSFRGMLGKK